MHHYPIRAKYKNIAVPIQSEGYDAVSQQAGEQLRWVFISGHNDDKPPRL